MLIAALNWASLNAVFDTVAYYSASASVTGITFSAGILNFSLLAPADFPEIKNQVDVSNRAVKITDTGDIEFLYAVSVATATTTIDVCDNLLLDASLDGISVFNGKLADFNYDAGEYATTTADWLFSVKVDDFDKVIYDSDCYFDFVFTGRQTEGPGFTHTETLSNHVRVVRNAPIVDVIYPDGGQVWYSVDPLCLANAACRHWCATRDPDKMNGDCQYEIKWTAHNPYGLDSDLLVDLYYSNDSGQTWLPPFAVNEENDGSFFWKVPYDMAYVTHLARIKVVAHGKNNAAFTGEAVSENDFCPPMLSIEDLMNQIGDLGGTGSANSGSIEPRPVSDASLDPAEIKPMTAEEITTAIDDIRGATSTVETADENQAETDGKIPAIEPFAAPSGTDNGQTMDAISGPPAIIPSSKDSENATSTDSGDD